MINLRVAAAALVATVMAAGLIVATAGPASATSCGDPRDDIFCYTWNGSQLGAWDMDGGKPITDSTINTETGDGLGLNVIRYEMWRQPCALATADTTTPGTTCTTTAQFDGAINGIKAAELSADPLIVLPPIVNTTGNNQCPDSSSTSQKVSLDWAKWIISRGALDGAELFELGNEPNNYCSSSLGSIADYETFWDSYVPALRQYARDESLETVFIGGPAWTSFESWDESAMEDFVDHTHDQYISHSNNFDYVPDFVSVHTYLTSSQNTSQSAAQTQIDNWEDRFTTLQSFITSEWTGVSRSGYAVGDMVKIVDSEYNDTIDTGSSINNSQGWCDFYYAAMFNMANNSGIWGWVQFTLSATDNGALNLVNPANGDENACFSSYANQT